MFNRYNPNDHFESAIALSDAVMDKIIRECKHEFATVTQMIDDSDGREMEIEDEVCGECHINKSLIA